MKNAMLTFAVYAIRILAIVAGAIVLWALCVVVLSGCGGPPFSSAGFFDPSEGGIPPLAVMPTPVDDAGSPAPEASPPVTTPETGPQAPVEDAGPPVTKPDAGTALCCTWQSDAGTESVACIQHSWACDKPRQIDFCDTSDPTVPPCPIGFPCQNETANTPGWPTFAIGIVAVCP
jgi:hypothetical protein